VSSLPGGSGGEYADGWQFDSVVVITASISIVLGMFWGPFTQNLIRYESGNITAPGETALLSRSVEYSAHGISMEYGSKTRLAYLH
jgi:hypothetical protein